VIVFLFLQIAIPVYQLVAPKPSRFGWHMFAALPERPVLTLVFADGTETEIDDLNQFFGYPRGDIRMMEVLPDYLCETREKLTSIKIKYPDDSVGETCLCP